MYTTQVYYNQLKDNVSLQDILVSKNKYLGTKRLARLLKLSERTLQRKKNPSHASIPVADFKTFYIDFNFNHFSLLDLDVTEYGILAIINAIAQSTRKDFTYISFGKIADILNIDSHTVGYKIKKLEQKGLLEKTKRPSRKCLRYYLTLTEKWFDAYDEAIKTDLFGENEVSDNNHRTNRSNKTLLIELRPDNREFNDFLETEDSFGTYEPLQSDTEEPETKFEPSKDDDDDCVLDLNNIILPKTESITKEDIEKYVKEEKRLEAIWDHYRINIRNQDCDKKELRGRIIKYIKRYLNPEASHNEQNNRIIINVELSDDLNEEDLRKYLNEGDDVKYAWDLYNRKIAKDGPEAARKLITQYIKYACGA